MLMGVCFIVAAVVLFMLARLNDKLRERRVGKMEATAPEPFVFVLPIFAGRVLPSGDVHPGTFTISALFEEVSSWGRDAVMAYTVMRDYYSDSSQTVDLRAWRPDPQTPGVFQFARQEFKVEGWPSAYGIGEVEVVKGEMVLRPCVLNKDAGEGWVFLFIFTGALAAVIGIIAIAVHFLGLLWG